MIEDPTRRDIGEDQEGRFANHFHIGHNAFEVILQFGQYYEGDEQAVMHTRIVTCPAYAETLLQLLGITMEQYKSTFGPISTEDHNE